MCAASAARTFNSLMASFASHQAGTLGGNSVSFLGTSIYRSQLFLHTLAYNETKDVFATTECILLICIWRMLTTRFKTVISLLNRLSKEHISTLLSTKKIK